MLCALLQGFGYAGGHLELFAGLAPGSGPLCWQSWVACFAASSATNCQVTGGFCSSKASFLEPAQCMAVFLPLASLAL